MATLVLDYEEALELSVLAKDEVRSLEKLLIEHPDTYARGSYRDSHARLKVLVEKLNVVRLETV